MFQARKRPQPARRGRSSRSRRGAGGYDRARAAVRKGVGGLEQRHYDVIGLALVAAALYLGFVLYLDSDGGRAGEGLEVGLAWAGGVAGYAAPVLLAVAGLGLILRPFIPSPGALNAGVAFFVLGLLLAFAAETAGLGPERPVREGFFDPRYFEEHGGAIGEALYWASTTLFQRLGAHIIAALLLVAGLLLATGGSIAGGLRGVGRMARSAGRGARELAGATRVMVADQRRPVPAWGPEEPRDTDIAITRASSTEAFETEALAGGEDEEPEEFARADQNEHGFTDTGSERLVELPEEPEPDAEAEPPEADEETDRGAHADGQEAKRGHRVGGDRLHLAAAEGAREGQGEDVGPDTRDREADRALRCSRRSATSGSRRSLVGVVSGPHVSRYELQLAPGTKVCEGRPAQGRPRLRPGLDRHPDPRPDPGQASGRRRGAEQRAGASSASATSTRGARRARRRWSAGWARTSRARRSPATSR